MPMWKDQVVVVVVVVATHYTSTKQGRFVKATAGSIAHGPESSVGAKYPYILLPDLPLTPRNTASLKDRATCPPQVATRVAPSSHILLHAWGQPPVVCGRQF